MKETSKGLWTVRSVADVSYPKGGNRSAAELEENSFWFAHRREIILDQIHKHRPPGCVVDLGGGNGFMSRALQDAGYDVILVEPGTDGVSVAKARGVANVVHAAFGDLTVPNGTLPSVALFDVLEHIDNDLDFLIDLRARMASGSRLYISVPAYQLLWSQVDVHSGHFRRYTKKSLHQKLVLAGFECEVETYFFMPLVLPLFLGRVIPNLFGRSRGSTQSGAKAEHLVKRSLLKTIMDRLLSLEQRWLKSGRKLFTGSSYWVVAR